MPCSVKSIAGTEVASGVCIELLADLARTNDITSGLSDTRRGAREALCPTLVILLTISFTVNMLNRRPVMFASQTTLGIHHFCRRSRSPA